MNKVKKCLIKVCACYWFQAILILLVGIDICCHISHGIIVENENIVFFFIGVLATFIVVGNYAQVKDIEKKFESKVTEINKKIEKYDEKAEKIEDSAEQKIIQYNCLAMLRISSVISKIPNEKTDPLIDSLNYSIQEYNSLKQENRVILNKIIEQIQFVYDNGLFNHADNNETIRCFLKELYNIKNTDIKLVDLYNNILILMR